VAVRKLLISLVPVGLCMWAGMFAGVFSLVHRTNIGDATAIAIIHHNITTLPGFAIRLAKLF